jgi:predicted dinucleotide-utilizing enzyme
MPADNTSLQISALARTYRLLLNEGDITRFQLKAKLIMAQTTMEDGSEINACSFDGGTSSAVVLYPKEVVMAAALQILEETDPANPAISGIDPSSVQADLSRTRIES